MLRQRLLGVLVTTGVLLATMTVPTASHAVLIPTDWGSARNGAGRTAYNGPAGVGASLATFKRHWSATGGTFSAPILVGNTVVATDSAVNGRTRLEAFDATTGTARWKNDVGASTTALGAPASDGNRVFVIIERPGTNIWRYDLNAYALTTGALSWTAQLGTSSVRLGPKPVLVTPGYLYVRGPVSNATRKVAKFSGRGVFQWSITAANPITNVAIGAGAMYTATAISISVSDADSGVLLSILGIGASSIAVTGGRLYIADGSRFAALNATGFVTTVWSKPTSPGCAASVAVISATVAYASQTCAGGAPLYVDKSTGLAPLVLQGIGANDVPVAAGALVVIAVNTGSLAAWNAGNGDRIVAPTTAGVVSLGNGGGPIIAKSLLVVPEVGRLEVFGA